MHNDIWPWPIPSRSFSHEFAIKMLKYVTSCRVRSTAHSSGWNFFPHLAQMITSRRGWLAWNDSWSWTICSRSFSHGLCSKSFSHDLAIKLLKYDTSYHVRPTACADGLFPKQKITSIRGCVNRSKVKVPWVILIFRVRRHYPNKSSIYNFLFLSGKVHFAQDCLTIS